MKTTLSLALLLFPVQLSLAGGMAHNENFVVITESSGTAEESNAFAQSVLSKAEQYRHEISLEWFGEELPPGIGRTTISVRFSADRDSGLTWAVDHPDRTMHTVYLNVRSLEAADRTLAHEMAHVVLATQFPHPHRLPAWVEEGIASQYDGPEKRETRARLLQFFARQDHWPTIEKILSAENIHAEDTRSYSVAVSLTDMLVRQAGKQRFLDFGRAARRDGTARALGSHYQITSAEQLQTRWQDWVRRSQTGQQPPLNGVASTRTAQ